MKKRNYKSTITDLPGDILKAIPANEITHATTPILVRILYEAKAGEFHDYKNEKYVCGKVALVNLLAETKDQRLDGIRQMVVEGYYDESPDGDDKAKMKQDWIDNGGTEESYTKIFGGE